MKNRMKTALYTFAFVTPCVLFATALFTTVFVETSNVGTDTLWQILQVSVLCCAGSLIYPEHEVSKRVAVILTIAHYIYVNVIVLGCGVWFKWFDVSNIFMVAAMFFLILVIYIVVSVILWKKASDTATLMNERLKEYRNRNAEEN